MWSFGGLATGFSLVLLIGAASALPARASAVISLRAHAPGRVLFDVGVHSHVSRAQAAAAAAASSTFPQYQASVKVGTASYTYVIAGKNPAVQVPSALSTIKTDLVPVIVKFSNGDTWDPTKIDGCDSGASPLSRVQKSPVFISQSWTWGGTSIGTGQVTNAFQRAGFWKYAQPTGINPSYGVSLSLTTLKPVTISVPKGDWKTSAISCGNRLLGEVNVSWLHSRLESAVLPALKGQGVGPSSLPIFLLHNVVEYDKSTCCDLGYHNAYSTTGGIQTYALSMYDNSKAFTGSSDISALTHEVGEWTDDPYGTNPTPAWGHVGQVSGCKTNLEVGDPLSGLTFTDKIGGFTYHPQQLAFFSWYYHQSPSLGVHGWYSDQGNFKTFAPPCWTPVEAPLPANAASTSQSVGLNDLACPATATCVAVGSYTDASGSLQGLFETSSGTSWAPAEAPLPAGATPAFADVGNVVCPSTTVCVAAGGYVDTSFNTQLMLLTGFGKSWTAVKAPLPANAAAAPQVSIAGPVCPSTTTCVAAGKYTTSSGNGVALLLTGSGTSWTPAKAPLPANAAVNPQVSIEDLACPSASSCVAVGSYVDSSGNTQGLLLTGAGTSWTATEAPLPSNASSIPNGVRISSVACPSTATCVAVGHYRDSAGNFYGLLLTGSGTSWTPAEAPVPARASFGPVGLASAACPATSKCVVTGYSHDSSGNYHGMMLTGLGTSWTPAEAPLPSGGTFAVVDDLACPSTCVVTGNYTDAAGHTQGLLLTGAGTSWTVQKAPLPAGAATNPTAFTGPVVCTSTTTCMTAGSYNDTKGNTQGLLLSDAG